jgi:hypothetical protein
VTLSFSLQGINLAVSYLTPESE